MGCIYRRGPAHNYLIKWYDADGKPHVESCKSKKRKDAERLLRERETAVDKGLPIAAAAGKMIFADGVASIENDYRARGRKSIGHLKSRIKNHLAPFFGARVDEDGACTGGRRLAGVTNDDINAYIAHRFDERAEPATIQNELAVLKRMFVLAMQAGRLHHRPYIPKMADSHVREGFFEREQFEEIRRRLPEHLRGVMTFAYITGWRMQSEVLTLEWRQVRFDAGVVRLEPGTTKNDKGRTFPFDIVPELLETLEREERRHTALRRQGRLCPFVFHDDGAPLFETTEHTGARYAVKALREAWAEACKAAGLPGKIPHDFRRTAVRNLVRAGVSEKVAMQMTGHKTRAVFDRYDIVNEADLRDAARKLATASTAKRGKR